MVISGVSVGMEICSKISPVSFPTAHTILVPPASNAPSLMNPSFLRCLARVLFPHARLFFSSSMLPYSQPASYIIFTDHALFFIKKCFRFP